MIKVENNNIPVFEQLHINNQILFPTQNQHDLLFVLINLSNNSINLSKVYCIILRDELYTIHCKVKIIIPSYMNIQQTLEGQNNCWQKQ